MSKEGHKTGATAAGKARSKSKKSGNKSGGSAGVTMSSSGNKWLSKESGNGIRVRKVFM